MSINKEYIYQNMDKLNISEELQNVFDFIAGDLSLELPVLELDMDYFLLACLINKKNRVFFCLDSILMTKTIDDIRNTYYQLISTKALAAVKKGREIKFNKEFKNLLNEAKKIAEDFNDKELFSDYILLAILKEDKDNNIKKLLNKAGIEYEKIKLKIINNRNFSFNNFHENEEYENNDIHSYEEENENINIIEKKIERNNLRENKKYNKIPTVHEYCTDLIDLVEKGKIDELIGRDNETKSIIFSLGRKKKNNVILVGGEGVGKTAIAEGLAYKIFKGEVPEFLINKKIFSLNMTALLSGTTLRGMFEDRVNKLINEIKNAKNIILFIDNIGAVLADNNKNDYDISEMLSKSLETGEIQVIGTSDFHSFRKTFDKNPSLSRRFQKIIIEAPNINDSINILKGIKTSYENFHHVIYNDEIIEKCVNLAFKYIPERNLPDSAIDIMDEVGVMTNTFIGSDEIKSIRNNIISLKNEISELKAKEDYNASDKLVEELAKQKLNLQLKKDEIEKYKISNPYKITIEDLLTVVSNKTGIETNSLTDDDKEHLNKINERLKKEIIGQDYAIDEICKAIKRNRVGLHKNGCMCSFLNAGKTGCGKTYLAKKLAKELFGNENCLVRFDMSEYSDKASVSKLIGSNPGYIGYEEGGHLTEAIKNKKHCVLLLDEIEKADPEVYNIFLQVLDEGFLTDNSGQKIDFKNVIVLFTSNIGTRTAENYGNGIGFKEDKNSNVRKILTKELKNKFPPEFLNRLDEIIYFNTLEDNSLKEIIRIELNNLIKNIKTIGYDLEYTENIVDFILKEIQEEKELGARPIKRCIQNNIENKITDAILENNLNNTKFKIDYTEKINISYKSL